MMYVGKDGMNAACGKLDQALGGANYLGIYFFIQFPQCQKENGQMSKASLQIDENLHLLGRTIIFHTITVMPLAGGQGGF